MGTQGRTRTWGQDSRPFRMTRCLVCQTLISRGSRCSAHAVDRTALRDSTRINGWQRSILKARVRVRDGYSCVLCGSRGPLEVDHITPLAAGGQDITTNMRTLCRSCNQARNRWRNRVRA